MAMASLMLPTPSQIASAQVHLSRRDEWLYSWTDGVRYISMPNSDRTRVYRVRVDGRGCQCRWYVVHQTMCSHALAAREAAHHDALNAWVSANEERHQRTVATARERYAEQIADEADRLLNELDDMHDLEVESEFAAVRATHEARQEARRSRKGYAELFGPDED